MIFVVLGVGIRMGTCPLKDFGIAVKYLTFSHFNMVQVIFLFLHVHAAQVVKLLASLKKNNNCSSLFRRN